jgi:hypothetical protein
MSITPTTPNFSQLARSYWDKPEGTTGKIVIGAGAIATGVAIFWGWGIIVPFFVAALANTVELVGLLIVLTILGSPVYSSKVRLIIKNVFQLTTRWITGFFIEMDPIGMLRNNVDTLRKQAQVFDTAVGQLAGSRQRLQSDIDNNNKEIRHDKSLVDAVDAQIADARSKMLTISDPGKKQDAQLEIERLLLSRQGFLQAATISKGTIDTEQAVLTQTDNMYAKLSRLRSLAKFKVDSLSLQADMLEKRRSAILASQKALGAAKMIIKGDPGSLAIVDQTIDYLNNEADDTIGQMNDFNDWSQKYLTDQDIQNGADAGDAEKMFAEMEKKLSAPVTLPGLPVLTATQGPDGMFATSSSTPTPTPSDYSDFVK